MENPYLGRQFGGLGVKYSKVVSHVCPATNVFILVLVHAFWRICVKNRTPPLNLTWKTPYFWGQFWGFGGKVPLSLGSMDFVPQKDSSLRQTTSFDVLRAQIGRRVFEKTAWHTFGDLWPWKVGQRSIQGQRHYLRWIGRPRYSGVCTWNHLPISNRSRVIRLWI